MIVVSHRGPVSFRREHDGTFSTRRGAGGVVSALAPLLRDRSDARWLAAAISDDDRAAVASGAVDVAGLRVDLLALDPEVHRLHYDVISNKILWFCFHLMFDPPREPSFDRALHEAWDAYRVVNRAFADRIADTAPADDVVLVQDLHLLLVPAMLRESRPDLAVTHFTHTPFCNPSGLRMLPDRVGDELLHSLGSTTAGFHVERWASAFEACADAHPGAPAPSSYAATFGPDIADLEAVGEGAATRRARAALEEQVGDRRAIVRVDRVEPSKNIARGFLAFAELLETRPDQRQRVSFVANLNPSRESLEEYRRYRADVEELAGQINDRWATRDWEPVVLVTEDDFPRSVAALQRADVILVNPIRDGLNLVAMEGPIVNRRDATLCLSRDAGAHDLIGDHALTVHPFDVSQTAAALDRGLAMDPEERHARAEAIRATVRAHPADRWLEALVGHARPAP